MLLLSSKTELRKAIPLKGFQMGPISCKCDRKKAELPKDSDAARFSLELLNSREICSLKMFEAASNSEISGQEHVHRREQEDSAEVPHTRYPVPRCTKGNQRICFIGEQLDVMVLGERADILCRQSPFFGG